MSLIIRILALFLPLVGCKKNTSYQESGPSRAANQEELPAPSTKESAAKSDAEVGGALSGFWYGDCLTSEEKSAIINYHFAPDKVTAEVHLFRDGFCSASRATVLVTMSYTIGVPNAAGRNIDFVATEAKVEVPRDQAMPQACKASSKNEVEIKTCLSDFMHIVGPQIYRVEGQALRLGNWREVKAGSRPTELLKEKWSRDPQLEINKEKSVEPATEPGFDAGPQ